MNVQLKHSGVLSALIFELVVSGVMLTASNNGCAQAYNQATSLYRKGKIEQAVKSYSRIVKECPKFYPAFMMLGVTYQRLQKFEAAGKYLHKAVELAPKTLEPRVNLGLYYLSQDQPLRASAEFRKAVTIDPRASSVWFDLGLSELKSGDPTSALADLKRASQLDPASARIRLAMIGAALKAKEPRLVSQQVDQLIASDHKDLRVLLELGTLLDEGGQSSLARQVFRRARSASPHPLADFLEAAEEAVMQGNYGQALAMLEAVSDLGKDSARWNELIGDTYYKLGKIGPALQYLQEAIRLDPHNKDYYLEFGTFLTQYHANDACLALFQAAERVFPGSVRIQSALAVAYMMKMQYSKSERILRGVISTSPDYLPAYQLLGESYSASHKWELLRKIAREIVARNPGDAAGWYYQSEADYELAMMHGGKPSAAESEVRKSLRLRREYAPAYYLLGKILAAENRNKEAVTALKNAASLGNDPSVFYTLALTYRKLGETTEGDRAIKEFRQAVARKKAAYRKLNVNINTPNVGEEDKVGR